MRILHVVPALKLASGGVTQAVVTMCGSLRKLGWTSEVATVQAPGAPDNYVSPEIPIYDLGPARTKWRWAPRLETWLNVNAQYYDVIILHGLWLYPSYAVLNAIGRVVRNERSAPRFYLFTHGMLDPWFQLHSSRRLKALRNKILWHFIENKIVNRVDGVLFTCEEEKMSARGTFPNYKPVAELVVGLGVECPPAFTSEMRVAFEGCAGDLPPSSSYLLFLGRIDPKKGVDLLINSLDSICRKSENVKMEIPHIVIAGPGGDTEYGRFILELAASVSAATKRDLAPNLHLHFHFTGMLVGDSKWGALYGCEAFVLASHQENFGISVVEALACSKPVLISNKVNIWTEILQSGACFADDDTVEGASVTLESWLRLGTEQRSEMSAAALKCYQNHYSCESAAKKLADSLGAV